MSDTIKDILQQLSISDGNQFLAALHIQMNGFLDEETIEKVTGLSSEQVYRMCLRGEFPPKQIIYGNVMGWRVRDIQHWLEKNYSRQYSVVNGND